jgi:hypothetical protein
MTRDQLRKHWTIIEAYKNGAEIEFKNRTGEWVWLDTPCFDSHNEYRIAPRDFEWARQRILEGRWVTAGHLGGCQIGPGPRNIHGRTGNDTSEGCPVSISMKDLLATDYRVVEDLSHS